MSVPEPLRLFLKYLRGLGINWPLDPAKFPNIHHQGTYVKRGSTCVRVIYNTLSKRFYLAMTGTTDPQDGTFFDSADPMETAKHVRSCFP